MTPLRTIQDIIRRRQGYQIPGWAGGTLEEQMQRGRTLPGGYDPASGAIRERPVIVDDEGYVTGNAPEDTRPSGEDDRVMARSLGGGRYEERVIGPGGRIEGFGDERDYAPLAASRPRILGRPPLPTSAPMMDAAAPPVPGSSPAFELAPPDATRMRVSYDPRTGEPHREFYERGRDPLAERIAYRDALQQWKPQGRRGLKEILKSVGISALLGIQANPQNPLAGAAGGAITGVAAPLVNPAFPGILSRNLKLRRENEAIDQQIKDDYNRVTAERMRVATQEAQADLIPDPQHPGRMMRRPQPRQSRIVERADGVYEISEQYPDGRKLGNIPAEAKKSRSDIRYFEREDGVYGVYEDSEGNAKSFRVEGVPGKPASDAQAAQAAEGEAVAESTQAAADTLKGELDQHRTQLTENERAINQKEAYWKAEAAKRAKAQFIDVKEALEQVKAEDPDLATYDQTVENTRRLKEAIDTKQKQYDGMLKDIREGRAKVARGGSDRSRASTGRYAGQRISRTNLPEAARRLKMTEAETETYLKREGATIY